MKICFTADEKKGLESILSYHFGHCPYFVIVDIDDNVVKNVESIDNPMVESHITGELPEYMKKQEIDVIITGGIGPKAQKYFEDFGIKTVTGSYGVLQDVLEEFLNDKIIVEKAKEETHPHTEGEISDIGKLKVEVAALREQVAQLKSIVKKIEKKM
jgi:predicted Fe-Mo cluster-binding NifX family protein